MGSDGALLDRFEIIVDAHAESVDLDEVLAEFLLKVIDRAGRLGPHSWRRGPDRAMRFPDGPDAGVATTSLPGRPPSPSARPRDMSKGSPTKHYNNPRHSVVGVLQIIVGTEMV